jgi:hypothetical protein
MNPMNTFKPTNTFNTGISQDTRINTLKQPTHTQYININSKYRNTSLYSLSEDFQLSLSDVDGRRIVELEVTNIQIPQTAYHQLSISKSNNIFWVSASNTQRKTQLYACTLPNGNYTLETLTTTINNILATLATESDENFDGITMTIDTTNMKTTFNIPADSGVFFSIIFYDVTMSAMSNIGATFQDTLGWTLGFIAPFYSYYNVPLVSEMTCKLWDDRIVYLSVNDYQYNNNSNNIVMNEKSRMDFIVGKAIVPVVNHLLPYDYFGIQKWYSFPRKYNGPVDLKKIGVKLLDETGKPVNLNNADFTFTLKLIAAYDL